MTARTIIILFLACTHIVRGDTSLEVTVTGVPRAATALVFLIDTVSVEQGPGYEETPAVPPPAPSLPAAAAPADPAAAAAAAEAAQAVQRRRRAAAPKPPSPVRSELKLVAPLNPSVVWRTSAPVADNVRLRVIAIRGDDAFPLVIASGKAVGLKTAASTVTPVALTLAPPTLKLATDSPPTVAPGAKFMLAGVVTDPGSFLGAKNRMRVWLSAGAPPTRERTGTQISTVDVSTKGEDAAFTFELTAPTESGPLYFQFGETAVEFARADGTQAPFLVLPAIGGGSLPHVQVQRTAAAAANK